jgi:hypothetical protein
MNLMLECLKGKLTRISTNKEISQITVNKEQMNIPLNKSFHQQAPTSILRSKRNLEASLRMWVVK